jgi:hypothetical protein
MLDTSHVPCAHVPKGILCNPSNQPKQRLALTSPTWARGFSRVLRHSACPRGTKNEVPMQRRTRAANGLGGRIRRGPFWIETCRQDSRLWASPLGAPRSRKAEFLLLPKTLSSGCPRARARGLNPIFQPSVYLARVNAIRRNREQLRKSGGKAVNRVTAHILQCASICAWLLSGLIGLDESYLLAWPIQDKGEKRMGTIHRLWPVPALTESRARARCSQVRRFAVRCQLLDGCRRLAEIISREIAGNRRGTGGLTGWLVSLWR